MITITRPAPEYFRREQIITQIGTGVELARVVVEAGETYVAVSTPAAPNWGISYFGENVPDGEPSGHLADLLPPNVGLIHRRGLPRTNRALVRALGSILAGQRLEGCTVHTSAGHRLDGALIGATVMVPTRLNPDHVHDLLSAYMPYESINLRMVPAPARALSRMITVHPKGDHS